MSENNVQRHWWAVRLRSLPDGVSVSERSHAVSERSRRHLQSHHQRRHCGLDPQSPENSAGDSCFRRNDEVGEWNDGMAYSRTGRAASKG